LATAILPLGFRDVRPALQQIGRKPGIQRRRRILKFLWRKDESPAQAFRQHGDGVFELFSLLLQQNGLRSRGI